MLFIKFKSLTIIIIIAPIAVVIIFIIIEIIITRFFIIRCINCFLIRLSIDLELVVVAVADFIS
jgi:hypothetical protein